MNSYFKLTDLEYFIGCNYKFQEYPIAIYEQLQYETDMGVYSIGTLFHDAIDHINGQRYIGGVADEIMASMAYDTMRYPIATKRFNCVGQIYDFLYKGWGVLPTALDNLLEKEIPKGKYLDIFHDNFKSLADINCLKKLLEDEISESISYENVIKFNKLCYWGMRLTLQKYSLERPVASAPINEARQYLINSYKEIMSLVKYDYLKISVTDTSLIMYAKYTKNDVWQLLEQITYHCKD